MVRLCGAAVTRSAAQDARTRPRRGSRPTMRAAATRSQRLEHGLLPGQWALWRGNESLATWAPAGTRSPRADAAGASPAQGFPAGLSIPQGFRHPKLQQLGWRDLPALSRGVLGYKAYPEPSSPWARLRCVLSLPVGARYQHQLIPGSGPFLQLLPSAFPIKAAQLLPEQPGIP